MKPPTSDYQQYARFIAAQDIPVFESEGALWVEKRKFFFEAIPSHRRVHLDKAAAERLFRRGAAVLRYTSNENEGDASFEYVCSAKPFSLDSLSSDARRRVRRGLEACEIRVVEFEQLAREGCSINRSTLLRQGRAGVHWMTDEEVWHRYMLGCVELNNVHALGAFVDGRLCGFSMAVTIDDYAYLYHTQARSEYLKYSPINALTYAMTKTMLERADINHVSQGLESFAPLPDVEAFKLSMGFRKRPLRRRLMVNPLAKPLFSPPAVWLAVKTLGKFKPGLAEDLVTFSGALRRRETPPKPDNATSH